MKLSTKDIISFCIDRGLKQFHIDCKWGLTNNADDIPESARNAIKGKKEDFFSEYNYFIIIKTEGANTEKISNLVAKSLTGSGPEDAGGFVQMASDSVIVAGLKIE